MAQGPDELLAIGGDLLPTTLLSAYRRGLFPMPLEPGVLGWWSPDPRGVLPLDGLVVSRSLRRDLRRYEVRVDTAFDEVIRACADPRRPHGWINRDVITAYTELHRLGYAHSVETWSVEDGSLVGGLYGVAIGGLFAGESMFSRRPGASKVALVALVDLLGGATGADEGRLLDVQWRTDHLASLGAVEVSRREYARRLRRALALPPPPAFASPPPNLSR